MNLGEGNTPLIESTRAGEAVGLKNLRFKLENCNPSGSYKDRFVAGEIGRMLEAGQRECIATSSGNTGSALAAGSARYGLKCTIVVNEQAPAGKLVQMQAHGARVLRVPGFIADPKLTSDVMDLLAEAARIQGMALVVSAYRYCPVGMARVEAIGHEIVYNSPKPPAIFVPVGGGGLFTAVARGAAGTRARVFAVQPERCNTVVKAWESGASHIEPVQSTTRISGLSVPFDIDAGIALQTLREQGGKALAVSDEEVWDAQRLILSHEGIYTEPAGAAAFAGAIKALQRGWIAPDDPVVALVTGHGFKDPDSVSMVAAKYPEQRIEAADLRNLLLGDK